MPLLITVVSVVIAVVLMILAIVSRRPSTFQVDRKIVIAAAPNTIFGYLDDFRQWTKWSPWEGLDPNLKRTYGGAERGVGATYEWAGNSKAGQGAMSITEAVPGAKVSLDLRFLKPFATHHRTEFDLAATPQGTRLSWAMTGTNSLPMKVMGMFMSMDKMIGKDFEKGLAALKELCE